MSLLKGLIAGAVGAEAVSFVSGLIEKHGGLQGIVSQFEKQGLGGTVQSWIGTGQNQAISTDQVHHVFGVDTIKELAAKAGLSTQDLASKLSAVLPQAVDKLTPDGKLPT